MTKGLKRGEVDIRALIEASLRRLPPRADLRVRFHADLPDPVVRIDGEGVGRTLADLLQNACEAMPAGGELTVNLTGQEDDIAIAVRDSGVGISPEHMDELFTPFFTTKPVGEGTGLSLAAAYDTVKAQGGRITVESNADPACGPTGTTVRITLPRRALLSAPKTRLILHDD